MLCMPRTRKARKSIWKDQKKNFNNLLRGPVEKLVPDVIHEGDRSSEEIISKASKNCFGELKPEVFSKYERRDQYQDLAKR